MGFIKNYDDLDSEDYRIGPDGDDLEVKEWDFDKKKETFLQNVINSSHLWFIKENKDDLCWFHQRSAGSAGGKRERYLFACHLGLFCVVNAIDFYGPEYGKRIGMLPYGKTICRLDEMELKKIIEDLLALISPLDPSNKTLPSFIHCEKTDNVYDILDWSLSRAPYWSDDAFWSIISF